MEAGNKNLSGGTNENRCAESWRSAFTLSQKLSVPNGKYLLKAQAALTEYTATGADLPVIYANDVTSVFPKMTEGENTMSKMSDQFSKGMYEVEPIQVEVTDGVLTIGAKGTRTDTWCIWDNFQLKYYGDVTVAAVKMKASVDAYNAAMDEAKGFSESSMYATDWTQFRPPRISSNCCSNCSKNCGQDTIKSMNSKLLEGIPWQPVVRIPYFHF
jgi:hypothetical protein